MKDFSQYIGIELTCTQCGKKIDKRATWVRDHPVFPCPHCGLDTGPHQIPGGPSTLEEVNKQLNDFGRRQGRR